MKTTKITKMIKTKIYIKTKPLQKKMNKLNKIQPRKNIRVLKFKKNKIQKFKKLMKRNII